METWQEHHQPSSLSELGYKCSSQKESIQKTYDMFVTKCYDLSSLTKQNFGLNSLIEQIWKNLSPSVTGERESAAVSNDIFTFRYILLYFFFHFILEVHDSSFLFFM